MPFYDYAGFGGEHCNDSPPEGRVFFPTRFQTFKILMLNYYFAFIRRDYER